MPYSSGTFTLIAGNPVVTGTTISSAWANNTLSDMASGMSVALLKDGTQIATGNQPMGGFHHTGVADATLPDQYATIRQLADTTNVANGDALIGIKRVLANAVATTLHATLETEAANVMVDFGAKGDGATDDTTAIQNALNAASFVYFPTPPGGFYKTTQPLAIASNQRLFGPGSTLVLIKNLSTNGITRAPAGDLSGAVIQGIGLIGPSGAANTLVGWDMTRWNSCTLIDVAATFHQTGFQFVRATGACFFNTLMGARCTSNKTGLLLGNTAGATCNSNVIFDFQCADVGVWAAGNAIDLSGYGNGFFGVYGGMPGGNAVIKLQNIAGNNVIERLYGESSITYLIDNSAGTSLRKNFVKGTHIDSLTMVKVQNAADADLIIDDQNGVTGSSLDPTNSGNLNGIVHSGVTVYGAEPAVDMTATGGGNGQRWRWISGGGGNFGTGYLGLRNETAGTNVASFAPGVAAGIIAADANGIAIKTFKTDIIATANLPAVGATQNGKVLIEDAGSGNTNLIYYGNNHRYRITGTSF